MRKVKLGHFAPENVAKALPSTEGSFDNADSKGMAFASVKGNCSSMSRRPTGPLSRGLVELPLLIWLRLVWQLGG